MGGEAPLRSERCLTTQDPPAALERIPHRCPGRHGIQGWRKTDRNVHGLNKDPLHEDSDGLSDPRATAVQHDELT
eukprot:8049829-Pyramimonas_sp.AAC.1